MSQAAKLYNWACGSCGTANRSSALTCSRCRASRRKAKEWRCKCEQLNGGTEYYCSACQLDMNGFARVRDTVQQMQ